jgi:hypothetical protein
MLPLSNRSIPIYQDAPIKPAYGATCNGCGICCLDELCPIAIVRYRRRKGPCPQLSWVPELQHYRCQWLVSASSPWLRWWVQRAIFAGKGCDSTAEVHVLESTDGHNY